MVIASGYVLSNYVVDSGTTLDVARDLDRRALGYDLSPTRKDIFRVDARKLPLENDSISILTLSVSISASDSPLRA